MRVWIFIGNGSIKMQGGSRGGGGLEGGGWIFFFFFFGRKKKEKQIKAKGAQTRPVMFGEGIFRF